jgi:hypothetical protein
VLLRNGEIERGVAILESLLRGRDPGWSEGWSLLAWAHGKRGAGDAAAIAQRNAELTRRNRAMLYHRMARSALWQEKPDDARALLAVALSADPEYAGAQEELERLDAPPRQARAP